MSEKTVCGTCNGVGWVYAEFGRASGSKDTLCPSCGYDPTACDICKKGCGGECQESANIAHANGDACPLARRDCTICFDDALAAGIPRSVIMGETKLTQHFTRAQIAREAGREVDNES